MANILIVEDELSISEPVRRNLQLVGHRCAQVYDGPGAVCVPERHSLDLALLDIMLPGLDGYRVFEHITDTPVIFLSAKSGLEDKLKGLTMGAYDYITKPFEMPELLDRVDNVLRRTKKAPTRLRRTMYP